MHNKVKVLHIQETIGFGGVERRRLSLAKHLDKNIFEQKFICTKTIGNIASEIEHEGHEIINIGLFKSLFHWNQYLKVQKIINEYRPDIIHGAVFEGVTLATINGWLKGVPIKIIEETSDPSNRSKRANKLLHFYSLLNDKFIAISPSVYTYLIEKVKVSPHKAELINNGVKIPKEYSSEEIKRLKDKYNIQDSDIVIGSVGRMIDDRHKRFSYLIKAFSRVSRSNENLKLILVGDGKEEQKYRSLAKDLNIDHQVIFTGFQSDPYPFYQLMDIFSLVSDREGFGLVLAEAMLSKLPVVATAVGGMKDIVKHNETGYLVEKGNIDQITNALSKLINSADRRSKFGENGFVRANINYSENVYVQNVQNLYIDLLKKKKYKIN